MAPSPRNEIPCGGLGNLKNGCQEIFPRNFNDLCFKCERLVIPGLSEEDVQKTMGMNQCMGCAVIGTNIRDPCGTCRRKDLEEAGQVDHARVDAAAQRRQRMDNTLGKSRVADPNRIQAQSAIGPTTSDAELGALRSNAKKTMWNVNFSVRLSTKANTIEKSLGHGCVQFPSEATMPDVLDELLEQVNVQWTRSGHTFCLSAEDCELRFHDNLNFHRNTEILSVKEFYHHYGGLSNKSLYFPDNKKYGTKGTFLVLEVYVHYHKWEQRTGGDHISDDQSIGLPKGKRHAPSTSQSQTKRLRSGSGPSRAPASVLSSQFVPDRGFRAHLSTMVAKFQLISFKRITCQIDVTTGFPTLSEDTTVEEGQLSNTPMKLIGSQQGRSKDVFPMKIQDQNYVAKKLFDIGKGRGVDLGSSEAVLLQELIRIMRMKHFRKMFVDCARRDGVEIADFRITDAFVINTSGSEQATYLVEPLRVSTAVVKFSGTMTTVNRTDKLFATIAAFTHYVVDETACTFCFADIQGSIDRTAEGESVMVLFDPMTHNFFGGGGLFTQGDTGLGDHGIPGVEQFIDAHICTPVCAKLGLSTKDIMEATLAAKKEELEKARTDGDGDTTLGPHDKTNTKHIRTYLPEDQSYVLNSGHQAD